MTEAPIFVAPLARSGGTLLATLLDAHSRCAMSYEIYPDLLVGPEETVLNARGALDALEASRTTQPIEWIRGAGLGKKFETFCFRARRGGLEVGELMADLRRHAEAGGELETLNGRLDFIDRLLRTKARNADKPRWGGKMKAPLDVLAERHPDARFLCSLRDGRDVLASQQKVGSFDADPEYVAQLWRDHVRSFERFAAQNPGRAHIVRYEELVTQPSAVIRAVCDFLEEPFDSAMLSFETQPLTLFDNPQGHLSAGQLREGLNQSSLGRWRNELSASDIEAFSRVAGGTLDRFGYPRG
ncbi:MAG: sulfotransferase [Acidobacteriota bacterium]